MELYSGKAYVDRDAVNDRYTASVLRYSKFERKEKRLARNEEISKKKGKN